MKTINWSQVEKEWDNRSEKSRLYERLLTLEFYDFLKEKHPDFIFYDAYEKPSLDLLVKLNKGVAIDFKTTTILAGEGMFQSLDILQFVPKCCKTRQFKNDNFLNESSTEEIFNNVYEEIKAEIEEKNHYYSDKKVNGVFIYSLLIQNGWLIKDRQQDIRVWAYRYAISLGESEEIYVHSYIKKDYVKLEKYDNIKRVVG